jgi:hypothetical protein
MIIGKAATGTKAPNRATNDLDRDRGPAEQVRERQAHRVQNRNEIIRAAGELGKAMLEEPEPENEPERHRVQACRNGQRRNGYPLQDGHGAHIASVRRDGGWRCSSYPVRCEGRRCYAAVQHAPHR